MLHMYEQNKLIHYRILYADMLTILWLNLNKISEVSILQSADKQGNLLFHFHAPDSKRRYLCTQTPSAVPKYFPCLHSFVLVIASDMHLEPESEKRAGKKS